MPSASCRKRCDVHVIVNPEYSEFHDQCFSSLDGEPVNLHIIPFTLGNIGIGRHIGFNTGTAEFVSFVDDDDYVIPGIFEKCYKALDDNPDTIGVVTQERCLINGELRLPSALNLTMPWTSYVKSMHHILMFRRELVLPYVELIKDCTTGEIAYLLIEILADGHKFCAVHEPGYVWRVHEGSGHNTIVMPEKHRIRGQMLLSEASK